MDAVCRTCHKRPDTAGLRRGLCRACYLRAWRGTELPVGAHCTFCPEQRHLVLRWTKVHTGAGVDGKTERVVTCQNCGFLADRIRPRPTTLIELRAVLRRERRASDRRQSWILDVTSPASERRAVPRRVRRRRTV